MFRLTERSDLTAAKYIGNVYLIEHSTMMHITSIVYVASLSVLSGAIVRRVWSTTLRWHTASLTLLTLAILGLAAPRPRIVAWPLRFAV